MYVDPIASYGTRREKNVVIRPRCVAQPRCWVTWVWAHVHLQSLVSEKSKSRKSYTDDDDWLGWGVFLFFSSLQSKRKADRLSVHPPNISGGEGLLLALHGWVVGIDKTRLERKQHGQKSDLPAVPGLLFWAGE